MGAWEWGVRWACAWMLLVAGGFERRLASGGRPGSAAPNENQGVGVAIMDLDDATAGIFANLIVWCALHREYTLHEDLQ